MLHSIELGLTHLSQYTRAARLPIHNNNNPKRKTKEHVMKCVACPNYDAAVSLSLPSKNCSHPTPPSIFSHFSNPACCCTSLKGFLRKKLIRQREVATTWRNPDIPCPRPLCPLNQLRTSPHVRKKKNKYKIAIHRHRHLTAWAAKTFYFILKTPSIPSFPLSGGV